MTYELILTKRNKVTYAYTYKGKRYPMIRLHDLFLSDYVGKEVLIRVYIDNDDKPKAP